MGVPSVAKALGPERPGHNKVGQVASHPGASDCWTGQLGCPPAKPPHTSQAVGSMDPPGFLGSEDMKIDFGL